MKTFLINPANDINELATGDDRTKVAFQNEVRITTAKTATDSTIEEPATQSAPKYPYNHVNTTESGHIKEYDDTPGKERIFEMHRSGTFYEISPDGSKVTKVFGDGFEIILADNAVIVGGNRNVIVNGDCNLLVQGDITEKVGGNYTQIVNGNYTLRVEGDYVSRATNHQIEGVSYQTILSGAINLQSAQTTIRKCHIVDFTLTGNIVANSLGSGAISNGTVDWANNGTTPTSKDPGKGQDVSDLITPAVDTQLSKKNTGNTQSRVFKKRFS